MENLTTQQAKEYLKQQGYYVDNLWHVDDVIQEHGCTEERAQEVLNFALSNEWTVSNIFDLIREGAENTNH